LAQTYDGGGSGGGGGGGGGGIIRVEYIIRPDGRVEKRVTGVAGEDCLKVTEKINEQLGTVVSTEKTEEYIQQKQTVSQSDVNALEDLKSTAW
jgi:hypothetical protein